MAVFALVVDTSTINAQVCGRGSIYGILESVLVTCLSASCLPNWWEHSSYRSLSRRLDVSILGFHLLADVRHTARGYTPPSSLQFPFTARRPETLSAIRDAWRVIALVGGGGGGGGGGKDRRRGVSE